MTTSITRLARRVPGRLPDPRQVGLLLVAGYLVQLGLRLAISLGRDGPTNIADETGYLANARVMAGGVPGELSLAAFYRGGYSLLLVPAYWLGAVPRTEYRYVLVTNALLSSLVFPLLYLLLRRVFRVGTRTAVGAAFLAALYPPLVVTTQFAWAESLLPVLVLLAAIALGGVVGAGTSWAAVGWAVACGGCAGALFTTHGRTAPVVVVLLGLLVAVALVRRDLVPGAVAGVAAAIVVTAAGQLLNTWLASESWGGPHDTELQRLVDNARDPGALGNVAALALGQYWYVAVATYGLAVLGLVQLGGLVGRGGHPAPGRWLGWAARREGGGAPVVGVFLLGSLVGLMLLVGWFLWPPVKPDHVVYGRYVEILVPPLLALGLVRLWSVRPRRVGVELLLGGTAALAAALVVRWYAGGLVGQRPLNWYTVLGLPPLMLTFAQIRPLTATLVAAVGACVLVAATRWSRALGALGLAAVLVVSSVELRVVGLEGIEDGAWGAQPVALSAVPGLNAPHEVRYDRATYSARGLYLYQWELDRARFVLFDSRRDPAPRGGWVIAGVDWPQAGPAGARRVWVDAANGQAVWWLPGCDPAAC